MVRQNSRTPFLILELLVGLLTAGSQIVAQTTTPTLNIGSVTLSLGLSLDTVHQQLEKAGYKYIDVEPNKNGEVKVVVTREDVTTLAKRMWVTFFDNDGELVFRAGSLTSIMRQVHTHPTDRDLAESMYALILARSSTSNRQAVVAQFS